MKIKFGLLALLGWTVLDGCDGKSDDTPAPTNTTGTDVTLNITGLEDLGSDFRYEGWVLDKDKNPTSAGVFTVNSTGVLSKTSFKVDKTKLNAATSFWVTIEPHPDNDPKPANTHILAGPFSSNSAALSVADADALGDDFSKASGSYFLLITSIPPVVARPVEVDLSGLWFGDADFSPITQLPYNPNLMLPVPPAGWKYEGWAFVKGIPLTTGKFTSGFIRDGSRPFTTGPQPGFNFPGEDFQGYAPDGITFPVNLSGAKIAISVEPDPDNSPLPFVLKPLVGTVPDPANRATRYNLTNNAANTNPSGTAKIGS